MKKSVNKIYFLNDFKNEQKKAGERSLLLNDFKFWTIFKMSRKMGLNNFFQWTENGVERKLFLNDFKKWTKKWVNKMYFWTISRMNKNGGKRNPFLKICSYNKFRINFTSKQILNQKKIYFWTNLKSEHKKVYERKLFFEQFKKWTKIILNDFKNRTEKGRWT